ncbi:MAG: PadR family transcriptional regulator, partial [Vicinamibacterales bacterium]
PRPGLDKNACSMHICVAHIWADVEQRETSMSMDRDRRGIDGHLPLRRVEFHILLSLAAGERHGYGIIQDIEVRGDTTVPDVGTMYRALARMVETGLIEAVVRRTAPEAGHERRNYYRITDKGLRVARAEARRLETLMRAARIGGLLAKETK